MYEPCLNRPPSYPCRIFVSIGCGWVYWVVNRLFSCSLLRPRLWGLNRINRNWVFLIYRMYCHPCSCGWNRNRLCLSNNALFDYRIFINTLLSWHLIKRLNWLFSAPHAPVPDAGPQSMGAYAGLTRETDRLLV